jgi:hypothetical protein
MNLDVFSEGVVFRRRVQHLVLALSLLLTLSFSGQDTLDKNAS